MQHYYTEGLILFYFRKPSIFPSISDRNLLNIFVIPKFMFPSLAFHGFYNTRGNTTLIVPSSCEKVSYKRTGQWRTVLLQDKIFLRIIIYCCSVSEYSPLFGKYLLVFPINYEAIVDGNYTLLFYTLGCGLKPEVSLVVLRSYSM